MRTIKFRAWDKKETGMYYDILHRPAFWDESKFTVMQFTGLLDKNGKEIYEGDIVQTFWGDKKKELLTQGEIRFDLEKLQWMIGKAPLFDIEVEVIGNIYENPELITPK